MIEDDKNRVKKIRSWLPDDVCLVDAASAGRLLGILKRDKNQYAGVILDHDFQLRAATINDTDLSGSSVVKWIKDLISPDVPVLVHSMNRKLPPVMVKALEDGGFSVTRIPMDDMTREHFLSWLEEVRECWEDPEQMEPKDAV